MHAVSHATCAIRSVKPVQMSSLCVAGVQSELLSDSYSRASDCSCRPVCVIHKYSITLRLTPDLHLPNIYLNQRQVHAISFCVKKVGKLVCLFMYPKSNTFSQISFRSLIESHCLWFLSCSNSRSTQDIFIHTNWSNGLVHRLWSGFTTPPACPIFRTCWIVMIKLSGCLPETLCIWPWGDAMLWHNRVSQVSLASKLNPPQCQKRAHTLLADLYDLRGGCSSLHSSEVWPWLETLSDDTITPSLTPDDG